MNEHDQRWRELVQAARSHEEPMPAARPEWGPRLLRRLRPAEWPPTAERLWHWYGLRGLGISAALLLLCLFWALQTRQDAQVFRPAVENVVAETFWLL